MLDWFKRHRKGLAVSIACFMAVIVMVTVALENYVPMVISQKSKEVKVKIDDDYNADLLNKPGAEPKFRTDAKFKILEIVPYRGMAEIGYGIAGEEPVDISKIKKEDYDKSLDQNFHQSQTVLAWNNTTKKYVNKNSFLRTTLKEALQLSASQVKKYEDNHLVDVLVVEPAQINAHPELIEQSDYISIHDDFAKGPNDYFNRYLYIYELYSYAAIHNQLSAKYYNSGNYPKFKGNGDTSTDLSMEVVAKLYRYSMIDEMPLSIPGYVVKKELDGYNNIQKLGYSISMATFLQNKKIMSPKKCFEKLFKDLHDNSWDFWEARKLMKYLCSGKTQSEVDKLVTEYEVGYSNAVDNDFVGKYNVTTVCAFAHGAGEQSSLMSKITLPDSIGDAIDTSGEEKWCKGVNNDSRDVAITIANAYCPTLTVLDVEPDNSFTLTELDVKSWIPADIRIKVAVVKMTMSEFVGIVNDLNSDYDMIYFGKNVDKMQGGKLYYTGITAKSEHLASLQGEKENKTDFQYSGNDITDRMIEKVRAFMDAGYPVAYAPDLVDASKINTDTKMYQFLDNDKDGMYTVADDQTLGGGSEAGLLNYANVKLGKAYVYDTLNCTIDEYQEGTGASISANGFNGLEVDTRFGSGNYRAYLYIDTDHNGIYNEWVNSGGSYTLDENYEKPIWSGNFTSGETVTVSGAKIPSSAMLGVVSYKLEIVKLSGGEPTGIRSNITGNVKCSASQKTISVLQLSDFTSYPEMDFTSSSSEATRFKNYALSSVVSDRFRIDVTAKDIMTTDFDTFEMLDYDVILVGFVDPAKKLPNADGILNKIAIAAGKGKGVIFTRDVLTYFNNNADADHWGSNMNYRVRTLLGMDRYKAFAGGAATAKDSEMAFTYSVLNKFCSQKYFSGMEENITSTGIVSRINEAKIARYPYVINIDNLSSKKADGFAAKSGIYQVDVDQEGAEVVNGVAYFCLDGNDGEKNYSISPRDARNNYYLWRNDSVFYSGIGRDSFKGGYDNEVKLFINTIISAYGLERSVNIDVTNLHQVSDFTYGKAYLLYGDVDFTEASIAGNKNVEFNLSTTGMSSPVIKIKFYKADADGNIYGDALKLRRDGTKFGLDVSGSEADEFVVSDGTDYIYQYPYAYLNSGANEHIRIVAEATDKGKTITDTVLIKALRRSMFDLD